MSPLGNSRGPCCVELPEYVLLVLAQVGACSLWAIVGGPCCVELPEYVLLVLAQVGACPLWAIVVGPAA
jgi:hypothetical protein